LASCETAPSKRDQFRFHLIYGDASGPTKRTRAHPAGAFAVSIGVVLTLLYLPPRFAQAGPGLERCLGSGPQIAQDGEHASVVSV
jgi:hypothetical protein